MKRLYSFVILLFFTCSAFSQYMRSSPSDLFNFHPKGIHYLSDSTAIAACSQAGEREKELVFINKEALITNILDVPGIVFDLAGYKGNVLVFYYNEQERSHEDSDIHVVLIDVVKQRIVADKEIYKIPGHDQIESMVGKDNNDEFSHLLIRTSRLPYYPGGDPDEKEIRLYKTTKSLKVLTLSENLEPSTHSLASVVMNGYFITTMADKKGMITVLGHANGLLTAERYDRSGLLLQTLTQPMELYCGKKSFFVECVRQYDPANDDRLAISIKYPDLKGKTAMMSVYLFDFAAKKGLTSGTVALDKNFTNEIVHDPQMPDPAVFRHPRSLHPVSVSFIGDRILFCNEEAYGLAKTRHDRRMHYYTFYGQGGIVSIFDTQLHLQHRTFISRNTETYWNGLSSGIRNGKLEIFGNEGSEATKYGFFCFRIDPMTGALERKEMEMDSLWRQRPVDPDVILRFRDHLVVTHPVPDSVYHTDLNCYMHTVPYLP
ncbi:MAG TPA: hypothetical protein VHD83_13930 [Puia sp.]|nr:hypothetical protein [Puia sp.]